MNRLHRLALSVVLLSFAGGSLAAIDLSKLVKAKKQLDKIEKVAAMVRPITEEEEYYIGRAVAANLMGKYPLWKNAAATRYVNLIGQWLAVHGERPEIFGGYRFALLDTPELNAFSAPGGIVLLSHGLLLAAESEDELAAVIAHELCHLSARDPVKAIKSERTKALGTFAAGELTAGSSEVVKVFQGSILDVTGTLLQKGYSRGQEKAADLGALTLLEASGYRRAALRSMLEKLSEKEKAKAKVFSAHPPCRDRIAYVDEKVKDDGRAGEPPARQARFSKTVNAAGK